MPAAVASRARDTPRGARSARDALPPAKKTKLSQPASKPAQNGLEALLDATRASKPTITAKMNGVKNNRRDRVDESSAVVRGGQSGHGDVDMLDSQDVINVSSGEEDTDSDADNDDAEAAVILANGHVDEDQPAEEDDADPEELSFGERLQAQEPDPEQPTQMVDVESAFVDSGDDSRALTTAARSQPLAAQSASSVAILLTQALKRDDRVDLDKCLVVTDINTISETIERLPSMLVGKLLQKIAERLHRRPGRPGMLMAWVRHSLSSHGGYLATQPQLVKQLATLDKVLKERSSGLQPLLALKGRLDMLNVQLDLRKSIQRQAANNDLDEAVIYVEGEEEPSSAEEDDETDNEDDVGESRKRTRQDIDEEEESSMDEMPTTMEMDEDDQEGSEDSEDLIDDEAEETEDDVGDDMSEPVSDDLDEDASESEEESRPAKRSTAARSGLSRRH